MPKTQIDTIVIYGGGLAGQMCAQALAHILPTDIQITLVEPPNADNADIFYGNVTAPTVYGFLNTINISEPELLLNGKTTFSFGTKYTLWGGLQSPWVQSYHLPLRAIGGVGFHHFVTRRHAKGRAEFDLAPYLISTQAALEGTFAHPPTQQNIPLARAENGYHFAPTDWARIFADSVKKSRVVHLMSDITNIQTDGETLSALILSNGQTLTADLFVDCSGPNAQLISNLAPHKNTGRTLGAISSVFKSDPLTSVCRVLSGTDFGWKSETPLQGATARLTIYDPDQENAALHTHGASNKSPVELTLGRRDQAWVGNCVSIGHAAVMVEPLTPAPMLLLQRDIERVLELIPTSPDMHIEAREYNRRYIEDHTHALLFQRALFETPNPPDTPYFKTARAQAISDKLSVKLEQFENRGIVVQYDNEVFNEQDWTILHFGMGRVPERYDPLADRVPDAQIEKTLTQMQMAIQHMAKQMPPHGAYLSKLIAYLKDKHG